MIKVHIIDSLSLRLVESSNLHTNTSISSKLTNRDGKIQKFVEFTFAYASELRGNTNLGTRHQYLKYRDL